VGLFEIPTALSQLTSGSGFASDTIRGWVNSVARNRNESARRLLGLRSHREKWTQCQLSRCLRKRNHPNSQYDGGITSSLYCVHSGIGQLSGIGTQFLFLGR
jgi:hypothetical protein